MSKYGAREQVEEINQRLGLIKGALSPECLQARVNNVRKKMNAFASKTVQETQTLKEDAAQLLNRLIVNNTSYEQEAEQQLKELELLNQELNSRLQSEIAQRKEKENMLVQMVEKKFKTLKGEIEKEKKTREEVIGQISTMLAKDVPQLMNTLVESGLELQQEEEKLAQNVSAEIAESQQYAAQFKQQQEQNCSKVYELIRELTIRAKKEVSEEKAVREQTHEELLNYVEDKCNQLGEE